MSSRQPSTRVSARYARMALALILAVGLGGCGDWQGLGASQRDERVDPEVRWVLEPTEILDLRGPATAVAGQAVELTVQAVIGSSSCNKPGELTLEVDAAARTVTVRATRLAAQADPMIPCTEDYGWQRQTATFTPAEPGTWRVLAERFRPGFGAPGMEDPRGELDIRVSE